MLAFVFYAFQSTAIEAHHASSDTGATAIELTDHHPANGSHEPRSGHHGGNCSVTACASIVMGQSGAGDFRLPLPRAAGLIPANLVLQGIVLAGEPPVPRFVSS